MLLHLEDGTHLVRELGMPTMGLRIRSITLNYNDVEGLLSAKPELLQQFIAVLSTRFSFEATQREQRDVYPIPKGENHDPEKRQA